MRSNPLTTYYNILNNGSSREKFATKPPFPVMLDVELTNHCNFCCRMCETGLGTSARKKGWMKDEAFQKILDDCGEARPALRFILRTDLPSPSGFAATSSAKIYAVSRRPFITKGTAPSAR
jgi:hypothetical protein